MKNQHLLIVCALLLLLFLFPVHLATGQDEVTNAADPNQITLVDVKGNKTVSNLTILSKVKTQVGDTISESVLSEDLKRLYSLGFFRDVRIEKESYKGGMKVTFVVAEKPVLSDIKIEGNRKIKEKDLRKIIQSTVGDFVDHKRIRDDIEGMKQLYVKKGFPDIHIDYRLEVDDSTNHATLQILVDEGVKMRIKDIVVEGNKNISAGEIKKVMQTKPQMWWFFRPGYLKEETLQGDLDRVKALYDDHGYGDAEVRYELKEPESEEGALLVKMVVSEGRKYEVGDIQVTGNTLFSADELMDKLEMKKGEPFSRRGLRTDMLSIQDHYFEHGYMDAQVSPASNFNDQSQKVDIAYKVTEGEITYVEKIRIQGNVKTKDIVIRRELRLYPGEPFDGVRLRRSKERLYNLGYFEDIRFDTEPGSTPNAKNLIVTVKEIKTGEFSFGGGYSSIDQAIGFIQVRQKNFDWQNFPSYTGAGQDIGLRLELGSVRQNAELSFTEPWAFGYPFSFGFDVFRKEINRNRSAGFFFDEKRTGGQIRLGKELTDFDRLGFAYRLEEVELTDIPDTASAALRAEEGSNLLSSSTLSYTHDERDNVFTPTKGYLVNTAIEAAGGPFGGDKDFYKWTAGASSYHQILEKNVLELKIRTGFADAFGDSDAVPLYERFYAGGARTIRGYQERRIGPRDPRTQDPVGGEVYWVANAEYAFPLFPDLIKGAVFYDVGSVYEKIDDLSADVFNGVGTGVRVKTPIGPVNLDMGYPLNDLPGESKKLRFYFSISQGF